MRKSLPETQETRLKHIHEEVVRTLTTIGDREALRRYLAAYAARNQKETK